MRHTLCVALTLVAAIPLFAQAAEGSIYRCHDARGAVLYSDLPCKGAERVHVEAGTADPAAAARLRTYREQLDQGAEERGSREREAGRIDAYAKLQHDADAARNTTAPEPYSAAAPEPYSAYGGYDVPYNDPSYGVPYGDRRRGAADKHRGRTRHAATRIVPQALHLPLPRPRLRR